jgi:hypothetical protein
MPTVSFEYCTSWDRVHANLIAGLRRAGYPDFAAVTGGNGNICCIVGWLTTRIGISVDSTCQYAIAEQTEGGIGYRFSMVTRNEGLGGKHSEPAGLIKVQKRSLSAGVSVYLFTERAPCTGCQASIRRWAETYDRDIVVQYRVPYTDTDHEVLDAVMRQAEAQTAPEARAAVARIRASFPRV